MMRYIVTLRNWWCGAQKHRQSRGRKTEKQKRNKEEKRKEKKKRTERCTEQNSEESSKTKTKDFLSRFSTFTISVCQKTNYNTEIISQIFGVSFSVENFHFVEFFVFIFMSRFFFRLRQRLTYT
jgi:hypothetical protein